MPPSSLTVPLPTHTLGCSAPFDTQLLDALVDTSVSTCLITKPSMLNVSVRLVDSSLNTGEIVVVMIESARSGQLAFLDESRRITLAIALCSILVLLHTRCRTCSGTASGTCVFGFLAATVDTRSFISMLLRHPSRNVTILLAHMLSSECGG